MIKDVEEVIRLEREHTDWRKQCLNMIASENVTSPSLRARLCSDFEHRYVNVFAPTLSSNWKDLSGMGSYQGTDYFERVEKKCWALLKDLFRVDYADYRPISGNIAVTAIWLALTQPGDYIMTRAPYHGGHGAGWDALAETLGRKIVHWGFDASRHSIDVDKSVKIIEEYQPKLLLCGASHFLFPDPVKELSEIAASNGAMLAYDGSHVMGLIAGKHFQDPVREGAEVLFGSSHKTFPGPQGGLILSNAGAETVKTLDSTLCYRVVDNYHPNRVAALTVAVAEMLEFGEAYAAQIIKNSKALAQSCREAGLDPLCEDQGYTESHQVLLDVSTAGLDGVKASHMLTEANIITSRAGLPKDEGSKKSSGLRIGTSELTRLGVKEADMNEVAELIYLVLSGKETKEKVKCRVQRFAEKHQTIHYSYDDGCPAY